MKLAFYVPMPGDLSEAPAWSLLFLLAAIVLLALAATGAVVYLLYCCWRAVRGKEQQ